jgi:circadian clock protein KaiC
MMRLPTGVAGLDLVLGGGLERGGAMVLAGAPGTGKTILAQQICFAVATSEHKAVYYTTLSEPHTKLVRHLQPFSFFDLESLGGRVEHIHLGDLLQGERQNGLEPMVSEVVRQALDARPSLIVIDSAKMLRDFAGERELRSALYDLTSRVAHTDTALLLLGEYTPDEMQSGAEFSLADGIIQLAYQPREPVDRRWLRIVKMRGGSHREGKHALCIGPEGIEVFPRIETLPPVEMVAVSGRIASGTPDLDRLMGGGMASGDATVVLGPSGAGKTIFALRYVAEGLERGQRCLYVTFQDTADQLVGMATSFGWDFESARSSGQLVISHVPMGSLDLDALASAARAELTDRPVGRVVIDSLAELVVAAREAERFPAYTRSLIGLIRAAGASLVVTTETTTHGPADQPLGGLVFLFHNVIQLRYIELGSQVGRALNVVKMRNSRHDMGLHRFTIGEHGLTIGDELEEVTGLLGWSALRTREASSPGP